MKSVQLKMSLDEVVFYRQGLFKAEDDLLVFPLDEFLEFREELYKYLEEAVEIVEDSRGNKSRHGPRVDAQRILNWVKKMEMEIEKLNQTDIQKNLLSYNK